MESSMHADRHHTATECGLQMWSVLAATHYCSTCTSEDDRVLSSAAAAILSPTCIGLAVAQPQPEQSALGVAAFDSDAFSTSAAGRLVILLVLVSMCKAVTNGAS